RPQAELGYSRSTTATRATPAHGSWNVARFKQSAEPFRWTRRQDPQARRSSLRPAASGIQVEHRRANLRHADLNQANLQQALLGGPISNVHPSEKPTFRRQTFGRTSTLQGHDCDSRLRFV